MKLYICHGTFPAPWRPGGHPCRNAYKALREAGHDPEITKVRGAAMLPDRIFNQTAGRQEVKRLTGSPWVPVLVTDDGEIVQDSKKIIEWARQNPAAAAAA
jgi:hypothetical protein